LRYKIKDIPSEGERVDLALPRELLADALDGLQADLEASSGSARLALEPTGDNVLVSGNLAALVTLPCGACLGPARVEVRVPMRMLFVPAGDEAVDTEDSLDQLDVAHHDGETLDLAPTLREQLILGVPMSPRCKEGCRGLCPVCGEDRNRRDCGHADAPAESPFAVLKNLKVD
jgi:uncharacterized protein